VADAGASPPELLAIGRVGKPHGLAGSFYVTQPRERVLNDTTFVVLNGREVEIAHRGGTSARPFLHLHGVETREQAEALRGTDLFVPRAETPPLEEDEWLAEDLVGCRVTDGERAIGVVAKLLPYPSCELLEVQRPEPGTKALLVPLIGDAVRTVDVAAKTIDINLTFLGEDAS
jgi:16S rRNA processing protein RimM